MLLPGEITVDNFAGGGGASDGMEIGLGCHVDIAINHDINAINMHKMNHPETKHYCESVWDVDPVEACAGRRVGLGWFSPDCKHFSKAKGGKPVDKNIRGLAWVGVRWAMSGPMRVFMLGYVEEFMTWGPLIETDKGLKPDKSRAGQTFNGFISALTTGISPTHPAWREMCIALDIQYDQKMKFKLFKGLGYKIEHRVLKAADYGVPTTRERFFMVGRNDGQPISWPKRTHAPANSEAVQTGKLMPYLTAADNVIDWSIPVKSIFNRKRPLADKTLQRIAKGIKRYVIDSDHPYIVPDTLQVPFITECANGSSQRNMPADEPLRTICAQVKGGHFALVTSHLVKFRGDNVGSAVDEPIPTVSAGGNHIGEVRAFLVKYYGTSSSAPVDEPLHTITTNDRFGLVVVKGVKYEIVDIGLRMLEPHELFLGMGFRPSYKISHAPDGSKWSKKVQVNRCGNAVCPPMATALVVSNFGNGRTDRMAA